MKRRRSSFESLRIRVRQLREEPLGRDEHWCARDANPWACAIALGILSSSVRSESVDLGSTEMSPSNRHHIDPCTDCSSPKFSWQWFCPSPVGLFGNPRKGPNNRHRSTSDGYQSVGSSSGMATGMRRPWPNGATNFAMGDSAQSSVGSGLTCTNAFREERLRAGAIQRISASRI